jgi:hypothetical protein
MVRPKCDSLNVCLWWVGEQPRNGSTMMFCTLGPGLEAESSGGEAGGRA